MKARITKRIVDSVVATETTGDVLLWDTEISGFGVRCRVEGSKFYVLKARCKGRQRWLTIGRHGSPWTPEEARLEALRILGEIANGNDPAANRDLDREAATVKDLCQLYLDEGCNTKKASTVYTDRGRIRRHVIPLLGSRRVKDITHADVQRFQLSISQGKTKLDQKTGKHGRAIVRGGRGTATRTCSLLGGIFTFAVARGFRSDNPVKGLKKHKDRNCERFLSLSELAVIGKALADAELAGAHRSGIGIIKLLMLTGCRKGEIENLKWSYVDFEWRCLRLPDSKTGAKIVPIGSAALELLRATGRHEENPYVFAGNSPGRSFTGLGDLWERIRSKAHLNDVRIHDLRHSFASIGAANGDSLQMIGKLLGHKDVKTTARYAHLSAHPVNMAADRISEAIAKAII